MNAQNQRERVLKHLTDNWHIDDGDGDGHYITREEIEAYAKAERDGRWQDCVPTLVTLGDNVWCFGDSDAECRMQVVNGAVVELPNR